MAESIQAKRIADFLETMPRAARRTTAAGLSHLAAVNDQQLGVLIQIGLESLAAMRITGMEDAGSRLGMNQEEAEGLVEAVTFLMSTAVAGDSPEDTIQHLQRAQLLPPDERHTKAVLNVVNMLKSKTSQIRGILERETLANSVLPSFQSLGTKVDVRLEFDKKGHLSQAVPVVVAYLFTDAPDGRIWFQMSKSQLKALFKNIERSLSEMETAEAWLAQVPSSSVG